MDHGQRMAHAQQRPRLGNRLVDGENALAKPRPHLHVPAVEPFGLLGIAAPFEFDGAADFGEHHNTRADVLHRGLRNPLDDTGMRPLAFADFGNG